MNVRQRPIRSFPFPAAGERQPYNEQRDKCPVVTHANAAPRFSFVWSSAESAKVTGSMNHVLREIRPTLSLAVPIMIGQLSQMLIGITDSVMIGHTGAVPLAAAAFAGSVFGVFYVLGIGLMQPVAVFVAHAHGAGRPAECGEYLRHGLVIALVFGALETVVQFALAVRLQWFDQPTEVLAVVNPYFLLIAGSTAPVLMTLALRQFGEALGRPWAPMVILLGGVALNVLLNWIFIYGHWGAPALGLTGAGVATLLARVAGLWALWIWVRRDARVRDWLPERWLAPMSAARFREMLRLGLPAAGMLLFEAGSFAAAAIMVGWLGAVPLAAHQIAITCAATTFMIPLGLAMAAGMRVSAARGAGQLERLRPIGYSTLAMSAAASAVFTTAFLAGGTVIAGWFVQETEVIVLAAQLLVIAAMFQFFDGVQVIGASLLRGLQDVKVPTLISFVAYWLIAVLAAYVGGIRLGFGAAGVWAALAAGLAFAAVCLAVRFRALTPVAAMRPKA